MKNETKKQADDLYDDFGYLLSIENKKVTQSDLDKINKLLDETANEDSNKNNS